MEETAPDPALPETESASAEKETSKNSREPLLGVLLLGAIVSFLLLAAAGIAWAVYGGIAKNQAERNELSISALGTAEEKTGEKEAEKKQEPAPVATPAPAETSKTTSAPVATPPSAQTIAVSVLNGGAAGGSAGKLAEAIKKEGYSQVTAGDTTGNYTGVVIYYAESAAKEAETLKTAVAKTYPTVTTAKAIATNKETSVSPLTVIIGK